MRNAKDCAGILIVEFAMVISLLSAVFVAILYIPLSIHNEGLMQSGIQAGTRAGARYATLAPNTDDVLECAIATASTYLSINKLDPGDFEINAKGETLTSGEIALRLNIRLRVLKKLGGMLTPSPCLTATYVLEGSSPQLPGTSGPDFSCI